MGRFEVKYQMFVAGGFFIILILNILTAFSSKYLLYSFGIYFLFIIIIFRIMVKKFSNPINKIKKGLEMVSYGEMSYRMEDDSEDEYFSVSTQFNEMVANLENIMNELESTQRTLQDQVKKRTKDLNNVNKELHKAMQELKNTQNRIIQSEKQKSLTAIVTGLAHEINNPLTGILGHINLIELREDISPYIREKLLNIKNQSIRIKDIINELNQLNPEIEKTKLNIQLSNLLEKLVKIIQNRKECESITFEKVFDIDEITVSGNHFSLWQIFEGVIENSIEAINSKKIKDGLIQIKLRKSIDKSQAVVDITDNGGGFENIDKAFDPFFTTKDRTQKKGIGLSIAYNLIQEHKGNIIIKNYKKGANVEIYLPLITNKGSTSESSGE